MGRISYRKQPGLVEGGFRVHQCCHRPHDRLRAREQDDGGLRRLLRARRRGCSCVLDVDGALMDFKDAVKANPITATAPETPAALSGKLGAIDGAAAKLSAASYPFIQSVDWSSDLYSRPLPGASPLAVTKAIDKALVMGASMDGKLLKEAAEAHHKALNGMDSKLVATQADYTAVNAALGKVIASVPTSQVMDTYNAFAKVVDGSVPAKLFSTVNPLEAVRSYDALVEFTNVVKAAQR